MTLAFDSPGHLERRIAANMAADISSDSSLGISRKAPSIGSLSMSTSMEDENRSYMADYMRANIQTPSIRVREQLRRAAKTPKTTRKLSEIVNSSSTSSTATKSDVKASSAAGTARISAIQRVQQTPAKSEASFVTDSSTNDLIVSTQTALRPNSSFPGFDAAQTGLAANVRIDGKKLHSLLNKINQGLEQENVLLKEEKDALETQYERALLDCERLRKQLDMQRQSIASTTPIGSPNIARSQGNDELLREIEILKREMAQQESIIERLEQDKGQNSTNGVSIVEREHLRGRVSELQAELQQEREARQDDEDHYRLDLEAAIDDSKRLKKQLEEERATAQMKMDRIRNELERAKKEDERNEDESVELLREDLRLAEERLDEYSLKIREAESLITEYQESQSSMEAELEEYDRLREDYEALAKDYNERENLVEQVQEERDEAKEKVSDLEIALTEKENDRLTLKLKLSQAKESGEVQQLREKVLLLETTLAMTREAVAAKEIPKTLGEGVSNGDMTPLHPNVAALRKPVDTPKSPPVLGDLSNASWLQSQTTFGENAIKRDLSNVRHEYDAVREAVDQKIESLQEANVFKAFIAAKERIDEMQDELDQIRINEDRKMRRLERLRCHSCKSHVHLPNDLDKSQSETIGDSSVLGRSILSSHNQQQNGEFLETVNEQLRVLKERWAIDQARVEEERIELKAEKEALQKERKQFQSRKEESKERAVRMHAVTLQDLGRARRLAGSFRLELLEESKRIKELRQDHLVLDQEVREIEREFERSGAHSERLEQELKNKTALFERLNKELQDSSYVDVSLAMHVNTLQIQVDRFAKEVETLQQERIKVLKERQELYKRRQEHQRKLLNANEELKGTREALFAHQRQIDEQVGTIETLHEDLRRQHNSLERVQKEHDQMYEQRKEILQDVDQLEAILKTVREESRQFGNELDRLREERREQRQKGGNPSIVQMEETALKKRQYERELERVSHDFMAFQKASQTQHQSECRGLLLQIRYEKAKFMRESDLRSDLIHQKNYILGLLSGLEINEEKVFKFLANIQTGGRAGLAQYPTKWKSHNHNAGVKSGKNKRFRIVAFTVLAFCRIRLMSENWQKTLGIKKSLRQAHLMAKKARFNLEEEGEADKTAMPMSAN